MVAFCSNRGGSDDIWVMSLPNGEPQRLIQLEGAEQFPAWTSDGRNVLFRSIQGADADIWQVALDGSNPQRIVGRDGNQTWTQFSPDGSRLYFVSDESGSYEIWFKSMETGEYEQVTNLGNLRGGIPNVDIFTKFAVSDDMLIYSAEVISGEIWILERRVPE